MDRSKLECDHCKTTGRQVTNDFCKNKSADSKKDEKKEVAKKRVSKPGKIQLVHLQ